MKNLRFFFLLLMCVATTSSAFADFEQNTELTDTFREKNIRLVVLCNFQGTNNILDIVTASRSPGYELSNFGLATLSDTINALAPLNISRIYTAPAYRAQQTTNLLGKAFSLAPDALGVDVRLSMQNFGSAEGEDYDDYKRRFTSAQNMLETGAPNGEAGVLVFNRLQDFLTSLTTLENETVVIVTHGFNFCYISKCLTGKYGSIPPRTGTFAIYDFSQVE